MRLDIAAGTAVRFEPGQTRDVNLVALAGERTVYGFRQELMGKLERTAAPKAGAAKVSRLKQTKRRQTKPNRAKERGAGAETEKIMTSGLAQARPSRSQRCYRGWDQDRISALVRRR